MAAIIMPRMKHTSFAYGQRKLREAGYKVTLCEKVDERRFKCPLCFRLMRDPVQTYRGQLACAYCYKEAKREDGRCPIDGESIHSDEVFHDKAKTREILVLDCYCTYQNNGCSWKGKVNNVEAHEESCQFSPQKCYYCEADVKRSTMDNHLDSCDKWTSDKRCLYIGCTYQPRSVADLKDHMQEEALSHAMLHTSLITKIRSEFGAHEEAWKIKDKQMETIVEELKNQIKLLMTYTTDLQNKYDAKTKKLESRISQLETASSSNQLTQGDTLDVSKSTPVSATNMRELRDTVTALNTDLSELNLRQQVFENVSYSGKLLWKISNISQRLHKANTGAITALHSAPVFTSQYGYKFCTRLYLNGDGMGKRSHVSLFFVMMKGEYDNLLEWPFTRQITFRMISQSNPQDDVIESFCPDPKSSSFKKPINDMNVASGCPLFVTKEKLTNGGYIKDDTLFIEVTVR